MRSIGTLSNENQARRLSFYLKRNKIENSCEVSFDPQNGSMSYQIWVHDEDQIDKASAAFQRFQSSPSDAEFDTPVQEQIEEEQQEIPEQEEEEMPLEEKPARRFAPHFTHFMLALCTLMFFLNAVEEIPMREEGLSEKSFLITPIQALLLYDLPPAIQLIEEIVQKYKITSDQKLENLTPEAAAALQTLEKTPFWRGAYEWVVLKVKGEDTAPAEGDLFVRIRQGEVWRLFTPAILHQDLLHILFNMIWLWVLGRPIEQRIGFFKTLLLTLAAGIGSNTVQYLMSGPFFIGYSGVVMGLAGFIWMRERTAPWEGYPLNRATILFLLLFIGAMFALQLGSFFVQIFSSSHFVLNIANTAHIVGALIGAWMGRFKFFAQKVPA